MPTKKCVACAEEIQKAAKLCKHCGTLQESPENSGSPSSERLSAKRYWWVVAGAVVVVLFLIVVGSNQNIAPDALDVTSEPTPTIQNYSPTGVAFAAGKDYFYVENGFAAKYDNTGGCNSFKFCSGVKVYSTEDCFTFSMKVTFTNKANEVIGKSSITSPYGLAAGERGDYEIGRATNYAFVELDNIRCIDLNRGK